MTEKIISFLICAGILIFIWLLCGGWIPVYGWGWKMSEEQEEYVTCTVCKGTTFSPYENGKKCTACGWTGKVKRK